MRTLYKYFLTALLVFISISCSKATDVRVTGYSLNSVIPAGLNSLRAVVCISLQNNGPQMQFNDAKGDLVYAVGDNRLAVGHFVAEPCTIAKGASEVDLTVTVMLDRDLSLLQALSMARNFHLEDFVVDASAEIKVQNMRKRLSYKNIPLKKFIGTQGQKK